MDFAKKMKLIRTTHGLTQEELAEKLGVSRGNIANLETGKVNPTNLLINCLTLTFGINKGWLLNDDFNDLQMFNKSDNYKQLILENYEQLDDAFKKFVSNQIQDLLKLQSKK